MSVQMKQRGSGGGASKSRDLLQVTAPRSRQDSPPPPAGQPLPPLSVRAGEDNLRGGGGGRMGSGSSSLKHIPDGQQLMEETGFSAAHLLRLHERFDFLDKDGRGHLRPEDFEEIRELTENPIGGRIIAAFFPPEKERLDFPSFVRILAHFRPIGKNRSRDRAQPEQANSRTGKLKFAFELYDQDRDGKISREELLQVLRAMLGLQVTEEQLRSIAERAVQEADIDGDGAISFDEFKKSLEKVDMEHKMNIRFLK